MSVETVSYMLLQAAIIIALAPLVAGIIKVTKARLQNRRGPSVLQVYYDLLKMFSKNNVVSPTTSWIFTAAPFIYFAAALSAAALVPMAVAISPVAFVRISDMFMLLYVLALGRFFLALASLDAGSSFGGMGGSREMFIAILAEPAILMALISVAFKAHSTGLSAMAGAPGGSFGVAGVFAAVAFFIVLIAETGRIPVDNPDTHLELTMVHEGMILEYSGRSLGLIVWAAAIKQLVMIGLFVTLFMPHLTGWLPLGQTVALFLQLGVCAVALAVVESVTNKMRLFRVPGFMAVSGLLSLLAIVAQ